MHSDVEVRPLVSEADAEAFHALNRLWIEEHFTMTAEDERVLSRPRETIVEPGGQVLVAVGPEGAVVGTVALMLVRPGVFELAKMTVADAARGQGVGRLLVQEAVGWARSHGGSLLFLGTNRRLESAIRRYTEAGFEPTTSAELGLSDYYERADVLMRLELD